jgi:hypothetical protein
MANVQVSGMIAGGPGAGSNRRPSDLQQTDRYDPDPPVTCNDGPATGP